MHGRIGDFVVEDPMVCQRSLVGRMSTHSVIQVLGHESSGIVSKGKCHASFLNSILKPVSRKVGAKVKSHKVGDRVAMEPGATCLACDACKSGRYNVILLPAALRTLY